MVALAALAAGCFSMESAPMRLGPREQIHLRSADVTPLEHALITNSGWYLFNAWPLVCGNVGEDARFAWSFFSDDVNLDVLHDRITRQAARRGCRVEELNVFNDEQVILTIPGVEFSIPLPYLLSYRRMQISCLFTKAACGGAQ